MRSLWHNPDVEALCLPRLRPIGRPGAQCVTLTDIARCRTRDLTGLSVQLSVGSWQISNAGPAWKFLFTLYTSLLRVQHPLEQDIKGLRIFS